jgi:type IV pilus assembly protein PilV
MKFHTQRSRGKAVMHQMKGVTLLEVLLAIVIFVIGMLALAHLQTNLTRSSTDANTRTVAASVGEDLLESLRAFRRVSTDPTAYCSPSPSTTTS